MIKLHSNGKDTGWLSKKPTRAELEKLSVEKLLIIAKRKKKFKESLLNFLDGVTL